MRNSKERTGGEGKEILHSKCPCSKFEPKILIGGNFIG